MLYRSLKPGGMIHLATSVQNKDRYSIWQFVHILYDHNRSAKTLAKMLENAGFKAIDILPEKQGVIPITATKPQRYAD